MGLSKFGQLPIQSGGTEMGKYGNGIRGSSKVGAVGGGKKKLLSLMRTSLDHQPKGAGDTENSSQTNLMSMINSKAAADIIN